MNFWLSLKDSCHSSVRSEHLIMTAPIATLSILDLEMHFITHQILMRNYLSYLRWNEAHILNQRAL